VQAVAGLQRYGKTLAAHLDDLGLLGPRFTGAHCIWLDDDDLVRMADRGATVAHFLDLGNVNFVPLNDAADQVVNCEDSSVVDSVMIGGRMVLSGRRFTSFDFESLRQRVNKTSARIRDERNRGSFAHMQAMTCFVSRHCVGLVRGHYRVQRRLDPQREDESSISS